MRIKKAGGKVFGAVLTALFSIIKCLTITHGSAKKC